MLVLLYFKAHAQSIKKSSDALGRELWWIRLKEEIRILEDGKPFAYIGNRCSALHGAGDFIIKYIVYTKNIIIVRSLWMDLSHNLTRVR